MRKIDDIKIAVIGMGYVGLPLAVAFGMRRPVIGFDINETRIKELQGGFDRTQEVTGKELNNLQNLQFVSDPTSISECNFYIVTVPTPVDKYKQPDLRPIKDATENVAKLLKSGDIVVYESTVFPGATEEICVPILEKYSGMALNQDFFVGYSPERINPGDRQHRITDIVKVTSGSTPYIADIVDQLYREIIKAGTFKAKSIKVAEAAKVIENTQRDLNIALMNELAIIFEKLEISTQDVLAAAKTKWNFLDFRPGLVGGHCIGVDPYYLTHKAEQVGYNPEIILSGRRLNDKMHVHIANRFMKALIKKKIELSEARLLILGATFKENCPDTRNSKVIDLVMELQSFGLRVDIYDPYISAGNCLDVNTLRIIPKPTTGLYDGIILAVAHKEFLDWGAAKISSFGRTKHVLFDVKGILPVASADLAL